MLVLDCSAAVAMTLETKEGVALSDLMVDNEEVIAPQLFYAEINSAFAKHVRAGDFDCKLAHRLIEEALDLVDVYVDMSKNYLEAFDEGIRHQHSTSDMFYLTLARRTGATLFTLDCRLISLCEQLKIDCTHAVAL